MVQTPDPETRQRAIETLRSATAVPSDEEAVRLLTAANWDLDRAAASYLDRPRRPWLLALFAPLRFAWQLIRTIARLLTRLLGGHAYAIESSPGDTPNERFRSFYEERHGTTHPPFFEGGYLQALSAAKDNVCFLVVYLHSESHGHTNRFCRNILADEAFVEAVSDCVFWAGSVTQRDGAAAQSRLRVSGMPFLAIVAAPSTVGGDIATSSFGTVLGVRTGVGSGAADWVRRVCTRYEGVLEGIRREREERDNARRLRDEQDAEYEAALRADREAEEREKEVMEQQKMEEAKLEERERRRERKRAGLGEEPEKGAGVASVVMRLPDGRRIGRRFHRDDKTEKVFDWAEVNCVDIEVACLVTSFPRRRLKYPEDAGLSVGEVGMFPSCMLLLEERDEE